MIKKVLIANRSEIAVRIIRAAREEGISSVAVYSDVDKDALHVRMADESYNIGLPPAKESYLNADKIIETALKANCQAIHPGYGFLAENADFAKKVEDAGLIFVGPSHASVLAMGDKIQARNLMTKAGVPVVPGILAKIDSFSHAKKEAEQLGYPILVKAAGGGGGKGIRLVSNSNELEAALEAAAREATSAFSDPRVYLEKYLEKPRHIEVQVLADSFGNTVHLFERECSIQRRHQKVIEESPSFIVDDDLRAKMGNAAVRAAKAVNYRSAGTIEFLVDQNKNFFFLEMNTRIQVEHPLTELITGLDLVRLQFRIANGAKIPFTQDQIHRHGHAIECRIYAEDPENNFLPSPGKLHLVRMPQGPGIRVDSGIETGLEISIYYDPILSKIIAWGENRETARQRMLIALRETVVLGVQTPVSFLLDVLNDPNFISGHTHTGFLEEHGFINKPPTDKEVPLEVLVAAALYRPERAVAAEGKTLSSTPWTEIGPWKIGG
ncbi:MAG: acetyl-CoA carboxylase biotin carboxylase subunit [Candidatus Riflebacteria bacterium]|nr:acetyl-CoA carboxylase biotin carboxylase subunit [Candidatus Riflebacteria bacterium]